jgi:sulfur carrier protein ThiS
MIVKVRGTLLQYVGYRSEIEVAGSTVREGLADLAHSFPQLDPVLFDREGTIRATHMVVLNGEAIRGEELDRDADEEDRIDLVTAISGG